MLEDSYETEKNVNGDNGILHQVLLSLQNSERKCEALFTESKYIKKYLPCFHSTLKPNSRIKYLTKEKSYASELFYTCKEGECHPTVYRREGTFFVHGLKISNQVRNSRLRVLLTFVVLTLRRRRVGRSFKWKC